MVEEIDNLTIKEAKMIDGVIALLDDEFERERIKDRKIKYDALNAESIYKKRWVTFGIAVAGLAISLALAILKIIGK